MIDCLAWIGTIIYGFGVLQHGFHLRDDVHYVEQFLAVRAIEGESVGVEIFDLAGQRHLAEF